MKLSNYLLILASFISLNSFTQSKEVKIKTTQLTDKIYKLEGRGGNILVLIGTDGTLLIDSQFAPLTSKIINAVASFSNQPINYLINTHWHGDHTGGNENLGKKDVIIVSHNNVRKRMSTDQMVRGRTKKASPKEALPIITFESDLTFYYNNEKIFVTHVHNAHTDGDALVYFTNSNVLHTGDAYFQGKFPYIDLNSGGSIDGYINGIQKIILLSDDETKIVPGHGKVATKKELKVYLKMLKNLRASVQKQIDAGKSIENVVANKAVIKNYSSYSGWINEEKILKVIYNSLVYSK